MKMSIGKEDAKLILDFMPLTPEDGSVDPSKVERLNRLLARLTKVAYQEKDDNGGS